MINVLDQIAVTPKPLDLAQWWGKLTRDQTVHPLAEEELAYLDFFSSNDVQPILRCRGLANQGTLNDEQRQKAMELYKGQPDPLARYANRENRRRIVAHYVSIHPATIQYELGLYRLSRDVNPVSFIAERIHELFTGEEAFTGERASRIRAGAELLVPIVIGRVLRATRVTAPPRVGRSLTDPIYDLPPEGGGMNINGRWYSEHALERMAPDTPQIRAELRSRVARRLERLGIRQGSEAWDACLNRALQRVDPRGVPPSVVEAEIASPGSTNVRVITAKLRSIVVTVIPRH